MRVDENGDVIGLTLINAGWIAQEKGEVSVSLPTPIAPDDLAAAFR